MMGPVPEMLVRSVAEGARPRGAVTVSSGAGALGAGVCARRGATRASSIAATATGSRSRLREPGANNAPLTVGCADLLIMALDATPSLKRTRFHSICLRAFGCAKWIAETTA
jgi:hypothetical protein